MENKVTISIWEYEQFVRAQERICILERIVGKQDYVTVDDVKAVLGIAGKEKATVAENG